MFGKNFLVSWAKNDRSKLRQKLFPQNAKLRGWHHPLTANLLMYKENHGFTLGLPNSDIPILYSF